MKVSGSLLTPWIGCVIYLCFVGLLIREAANPLGASALWVLGIGFGLVLAIALNNTFLAILKGVRRTYDDGQ